MGVMLMGFISQMVEEGKCGMSVDARVLPGRGLDYWTGPLCFIFQTSANTRRLDFSSDRAAVEQQTKKDVVTMSASLE